MSSKTYLFDTSMSDLLDIEPCNISDQELKDFINLLEHHSVPSWNAGMKENYPYSFPHSEETKKKLSHYMKTIGNKLHGPPCRKNADCSNTKLVLTGEDRTFKQKESSKKHSHRMKNSTPWNKGMKNKYKQSEWNEESKRKLKEKLDKEPAIKCIHCGKVGKGLSMQRWHFGNCKHRHNSKRI